MASLKDSFSKRESQLVAEKAKALDSFQQIETQFRLCDDAFRQQLAERTKQNDAVYIKLQRVQEEVCPGSVPASFVRGLAGSRARTSSSCPPPLPPFLCGLARLSAAHMALHTRQSQPQPLRPRAQVEIERKRVYACNVERTRLYAEIDELKQHSTSRIDQIRALIDQQ